MSEIPENPRYSTSTKSKVVFPQEVFQSLTSLSDSTPIKNARSTSDPVSKDKWKGWGGVWAPAKKYADDPKIRGTLNALSDVIATLDSVITILKTVGSMLNAFQTDANNLFKVVNAAIQMMLKTLEEMAVSLASTGIYVLPILPETSPFDPDADAGGGFSKFKTKVSGALTNKSDPNRPIFFEGDRMGGLVVALTAGTNLGALLKDLSILARWGQNECTRGLVKPVEALTATPGLFYETEGSQTGVIDALTDYLSAVAGKKLPGIRVSWSPPPGIPYSTIEGYHLYRSKSREGDIVTLSKARTDTLVNPGKGTRDYIDFTFNGGSPVFVRGSDENMSYVDFEVIDGETYYYRVIPLWKDEKENLAEAAAISAFTSATANSCIPDALLTKSYETPDGLLKGVASGDPPYWSNLTVRGMLGESLDSLLESLHGLADRLYGVTVSGSSHFEDMLDMLGKWVADLQDLLAKIKAVLDSLVALQFSSSAMMLKIPMQDGGVKAFQDRFNAAVLSESLAAANKDTLCSIYAGVVFILGYPTSDSLDKLGGAKDAEIAKIMQAGKMEQAKAALKRTQDVLNDEADAEEGYLGESRNLAKSVPSKSKDIADDALSWLLSLVGG